MVQAKTAVFFDCEFLTAPGAPQRFWCGPADPDPIVIQIGAAALSLDPPFEITDRLSDVVAPHGRDGAPVVPDPLVETLTGLSPTALAAGRPLAHALERFAAFVGPAPIWSWGKDELNLMAVSCYVAGLTPPLPATRFLNAVHLAEIAGLSRDEVHKTRSNTLPHAFGLRFDHLRAHDAQQDAEAVALTVQHLLRQGDLSPADVAGEPL